ncbi:hypothetical protein BDY21DRAFT_114596, partial [Lineolata rhizophorae]
SSFSGLDHTPQPICLPHLRLSSQRSRHTANRPVRRANKRRSGSCTQTMPRTARGSATSASTSTRRASSRRARTRSARTRGSTTARTSAASRASPTPWTISTWGPGSTTSTGTVSRATTWPWVSRRVARPPTRRLIRADTIRLMRSSGGRSKTLRSAVWRTFGVRAPMLRRQTT